MAENNVGLFTEDNGNPSFMRFGSFAALIASIGFGSVTIYMASEQGVLITFGFLIAAFAPKAVQKFAEVNIK